MASSMLQKSFAGVSLGQKGSEVRLRLRSFTSEVHAAAMRMGCLSPNSPQRDVRECLQSGGHLRAGPARASLCSAWEA